MLPRADLTLLRCHVSSRPWPASATATNGRTPIATPVSTPGSGLYRRSRRCRNPRRTECRVNGRRSRSHATARRAAIDAVPVSGTIDSEIDGLFSSRPGMPVGPLGRAVAGLVRRGRAGRGLPRPEPGAGSAGRGAAGAALTGRRAQIRAQTTCQRPVPCSRTGLWPW